MFHLDERTRYTIRVQGCVDDALTDWFGPVLTMHERDAAGQAVTTLTGTVADQAALVGLVRHLHALGIVLLTVERELCADTTGEMP